MCSDDSFCTAGESVLNDAVAIVLFQSFDLLDMKDLSITWDQAGAMFTTFLSVSVGSILIGISFGVCAAIITRKVVKDAHAHSEVTIIVSIAYLSFIVSDACGFSGLMTIFFCGVMMSHYAKYNISEEGRDTTANVTRVLAYISETFVFIYFGFIILPTLAASCDRVDSYVIDWAFVTWTALLCIISRAANIVPLTLLLNAFKRSPEAKKTRISMSSMLVIWFAGLRGAIAFALSLTFDGESRRYIIPCVVIIILFTNVVLGQGTAPLLHFLGIRTGVKPDDDNVFTPGEQRDSVVGSVNPKRHSMLLSRGNLGDAAAHQNEETVLKKQSSVQRKNTLDELMHAGREEGVEGAEGQSASRSTQESSNGSSEGEGRQGSRVVIGAFQREGGNMGVIGPFRREGSERALTFRRDGSDRTLPGVRARRDMAGASSASASAMSEAPLPRLACVKLHVWRHDRHQPLRALGQ